MFILHIHIKTINQHLIFFCFFAARNGSKQMKDR